MNLEQVNKKYEINTPSVSHTTQYTCPVSIFDKKIQWFSKSITTRKKS